MRHHRLLLLTFFLSSTFFSNAANAAAFQLYELGTPIVGTAGVGQAVITDDASTAYLNPAGMAFLPTSEYMLGSQIILPYVNFSKNSSTTISGDNGGNAGILVPGMSMYFAQSYSPSLKFGISLTSPYGGSVNYNDGWVGRYVVQDATFYTINVNPSVAYRFNDCFAVGAGVSLEYMNLHQTTALPVIPIVDGQVNVKADDFAPGFNLGVMFTPHPSTKMGVAYRSQITHNLHGGATFLKINATPNVSTKMVMPQNVIASIAQDLSNRFTLLAELGWSHWSSMQDTILTVQNFSAITPRNWNDTYRIGLGGQFKVTPNLILQAGASYDSSPANSTDRLPDLPMDRQIRVGAGVIYSIKKAVKLSFSYEYWNLGNAAINDTSSNGTLSGSYSRNYTNTVQASINVAV
jgi:long-chain fatty acid transport protein